MKMKSRQSGFLIVEVLISMIIVVMGIVGIAKLQHVAKNSNAQAIQRTQASNLTDSLIELIRANRDAINVYFPDDNTVILAGSPSAPGTLCSESSICSAEQQAHYDLWEWRRDLTGAVEIAAGESVGGLVNPIFCMLRPAGGGDGIYHFAVAWHSQSRQESQSIPENATASNCGTGVSDNAYDSAGSNDNAHRRVHWQEVFLDV